MLRKPRIVSACFDAVNVLAVAVILEVVIEMSRETLRDWHTVSIALLSMGETMYFPNLNTDFMMQGGALPGYLLPFTRCPPEVSSTGIFKNFLV